MGLVLLRRWRTLRFVTEYRSGKVSEFWIALSTWQGRTIVWKNECKANKGTMEECEDSQKQMEGEVQKNCATRPQWG